jgi:hypothetical protein
MKHGAQVASSAIFFSGLSRHSLCGVGRVGRAAGAAAHATMLRILKRWLGWDSNSGPFDFGDLRFGARQSSSTSQPQAQQRPPAAPRGEAPAQRGETPARGSASTQPAPPAAKPAAAKKAKKDRAPMDVLDNPQLTLDRPTADGFDPYNTGAFNRSASWEKIGRNKNH